MVGLIKTEQQRKVWDAIEARIDGQPVDGIGAEGTYSESVAAIQRSIRDGMRAARLAAICAMLPETEST